MKKLYVLIPFLMSLGCNRHVIEFIDPFTAIGATQEAPITQTTAIDVLWVVDNSGSMCQEQKLLSENFDRFISEITGKTLDFHIAVTTTHVPGEEVRGLIEPVAKPGFLQSTPQPVPGPNAVCLATFDAQGEVVDFQPFRDALSSAVNCLADTSTASQYDWTDGQISCALSGRPNCAQAVNGVDANGDSVYDVFDLFPDPASYRSIPKVLKAAEYRDDAGVIDTQRLSADFACMSLVGTRGYGLEKGLQAAIAAVDVDLTGGSVDAQGLPISANADPQRPNHGFIRQDANFAVIFVTDENDCSHDGSLEEFGNACGGNICDYENTSNMSGGSTSLVAPEALAQTFRERLEETKHRPVSDSELLIASIHGRPDRFDGPLPDCVAGEKPPIQPTCASPLGEAYSGDRYERFIRQFDRYFPNEATTQAMADDAAFDPKTDFSVEEFGWMCAGDFSPALQAIGKVIAANEGVCIREQVSPCASDQECRPRAFSGAPGTCVAHPTNSEERFCDSGIELTLTRVPGTVAMFEPNANPFCEPTSVRTERGETRCAVLPTRYQWVPCAASSGMIFEWTDPETVVGQQLQGYSLEVSYQSVPRVWEVQ